MVIRVPEKLFIQTLIIGGFSAEKVLEELERCKIQVPTKEEFVTMLEEIKAVVPHFATQPPTDEEIERLNLSPMYYYRFQKAAPPNVDIDGCEGTFKMLEDPRLRGFILSLTLAGLNPTDVELLINGRYHVTYESNEFQTYMKFFSNFDEWTFTDREFFVEQKVLDPDLKATLRKAALKGDRHYLVWKLGLGTDPHMSMEQIFQDMLGDCYFLFKEKMKHDPDTAQKFAQIAIRLSDRLDATNDKKRETTSLGDELKIKLTIDSTTNSSANIPSLKDVHIDIPAPEAPKANLQEMKFE